MPVLPESLPERVAQRIYRDTDRLIELAAAHYARQGTTVRPADLRQQLREHLLPLADAVLMNSPALFEAHLTNARRRHAGPTRDQELRRQMAALRQTLLLYLPVRDFELTNAAFAASVRLLTEENAEELFIAPEPETVVGPFDELADAYLNLLLIGTRREAQALLVEAAQTGIDVRALYLEVIQPVQREVGERWHAGLISVAEEHFCTATSELVMAQLYPFLIKKSRHDRRLVAATVAGDLHIVGLRMVADFLEHDGWDALLLGASVPAETLVRLTLDRAADLLVLGASMPHHVNLVQQIIAALRRAPGGERVRVMVGGRPFLDQPALWEQVGADAGAPDAHEAVRAARRLFNL